MASPKPTSLGNFTSLEKLLEAALVAHGKQPVQVVFCYYY